MSVNIQGKPYLVPGGNIGRNYNDLLTKEVCRLNQNECSERLLVFSQLILQRDPMIKTTRDVRALIGRRLEDWEKISSIFYYKKPNTVHKNNRGNL